jgi:non-ribosomal peptide synthetase component E (peptide arylation enzyme)
VAFLRDEGVLELCLPERLELVPEMPRTATGKIRKVELRQRYGGTGASGTDAATE